MTKSFNAEYACGVLNYERDDTSSRTHHIRTVSRSCEYARGFSNDQVDEKLYRKHRIHTVSRTCEYAFTARFGCLFFRLDI